MKRYGVLFTCLTVRATHLELAEDLTTDTFMVALIRFRARRDDPKVIWSDNGANFVRASKEVNLVVKGLNQDVISSQLTQFGTDWKFNPPSASWFGGIWESLVKITKRLLRSIVDDKLFTESELSTFLCEIEAIMNHDR